MNQNLINIKNDLTKLVSIPSTFNQNTIKPYQPFGDQIANAFNYVEHMCKRDNIKYINLNGYAMEIILGNAKEDLVILHHIDIVGINNIQKWNTNPFVLTAKDNLWFARGINDNKGPLIFSYYILIYLKQIYGEKIPIKIKIVIGGAEETTWQGINHYKKNRRLPKYVFSPDGNYPLVNVEKGILQFQISKIIEKQNFTINSKKQYLYNCFECILCLKDKEIIFSSDIQKSRNPHKLLGQNAIDKLINYILNNFKNTQDFLKIKNNFLSNDKSKFVKTTHTRYGGNSLCLTHISFDGSRIDLMIDIRYDNSLPYKKILENIQNENWTIKINKHFKIHEISSDANIVKLLIKAYKKITHSEEKPMYFAGASYARAFSNAVVFGTTFPGEKTNSHQPNENINIKNMIKSSLILFEGIKNIFDSEGGK